jgi:NAD+ synthase (glutamine-hydrolysing)
MYNADHLSMYNSNSGVPKTLVAFLVRWAAEHEFEGVGQAVLCDVAGTEISPKLLPTVIDGGIARCTEAIIGPFELHDFFLFQIVRYGFSPEKILFLARHTKFDRAYPEEEVRRWLRLFLQRFFTNQFKRSCVPDGPKVGSVSLSPRGDWRMPSDAVVREWLRGVESGS